MAHHKIDAKKLPDHGMLRLDRLDEFVTWAETQGFVREPIPPSAIFQVLRLRKAKRGLYIFYKKAGDQAYASAEQKCRPLIREWLRSTLAPRSANAEAEAEIMRTAQAAFEKHGRKLLGAPDPAITKPWVYVSIEYVQDKPESDIP